jgi:hypothetical protein
MWMLLRVNFAISYILEFSKEKSSQKEKNAVEKKKVPQPNQASVYILQDQQNPPAASEGQIPEAGLNSKEAQESQVNEDVGTECLFSHAGQQLTQTRNEHRQPQDDIVHVSLDPIQDQSSKFLRVTCAIVRDDSSHKKEYCYSNTC